jgi:hypothetical protein
MAPIRSLLWIGRGDDLGCGVVADAPSVDVAWAADLDDALGLPLGTFDVAVLDTEPAGRALSDVRRLRRMRGAPVLLVRLQPEEAWRIPELLAAGAAEVVLRGGDAAPIPDTELVARIEKLVPGAHPEPARTAAPPTEGIVCESAGLRESFELVGRAATSCATVLITGETGTGKELLARAVHRSGQRAERAFVAVNCAAFPDTLLESELFGHVRGAFTGAVKLREVRFCSYLMGGSGCEHRSSREVASYRRVLTPAGRSRSARVAPCYQAETRDERPRRTRTLDAWDERQPRRPPCLPASCRGDVRTAPSSGRG